MAVNIMGLLPSGKAPDALKAEISEMIAAVKPAPVAADEPAVILASGAVELADGKTTAAYQVTGDVTYAPNISWVGVKPGAGFRGAVALIRVAGGGVLGAAAANAVDAAKPAPVAPVTPTPANPAPVTPAPATNAERAAYNFTWGHGGWYKTGVLGRYFRNPDSDNFVEAWEYQRTDKTWEPVPEGGATYAQQPARVRVVATAGAPIGEGDAWQFTTAAPLSGFDSVYVGDGDSASKIIVANGKYAYTNNVNSRGVFGSPGTEYANGSWNAVDVQAGDKLEIKRSEGYAVGSVIRANGAREQIFAFKYGFTNNTAAGFQGWNFQKIKAELIRAAA